VIYGTLGGPSPSGDGTYDPDLLRLLTSVPVLAGVSRLYLSPIVDATGHYALRLFVVCYDSSTVFVYDPDVIEAQGQQAVPEAVLPTGPGPFAMAFDPSCGTRGLAGSSPTVGLVNAAGSPSPQRSLLDCDRYGSLADVAVSEVHGGEPDFMVRPTRGSARDSACEATASATCRASPTPSSR
jgi:hypothetical protein